MANKTLSELFGRYTPTSGRCAQIMRSAGSYKFRCNKEAKFIEVRVEFPSVYTKRDLQALENEIKSAYQLNYVHIIPIYGKELFSVSYIDEMLIELQRRGAVANGFFYDYDYDVDMERMTVEVKIGFSNGGIRLLYNDDTPQIAEQILKDEFGLDFTVSIIRDEERAAKLEAHKAELERADREKRLEKVREEQAKTPLASACSHFTPLEYLDGGILRCGSMLFDISSPTAIFGNAFSIERVTDLRDMISPDGTARVIVGQIFSPEIREVARGRKQVISFGVTNNEASVPCKLVVETKESSELIAKINACPVVAINGVYSTDDFSNTNEFVPSAIMEISKKSARVDNAPKKRVELHLHTQLSQMDAIIEPAKLIKTAKAYGHPAVAITDHSNVQAFPPAMEALDKLGGGIKILYGVEAYLVDDTARAVFGDQECSFNDEFVVFDIETTGLSSVTDKIIEIGAVRCRGEEILARFDTFIDPGFHIPEEITALTSITDEDVKGAPKLEDALKAFLEFAGDSMLVAHNASFDTSFIRRACNECGMRFSNTYLDTLAVSRYVNTDLKRHNLDALKDYFKLEDFHHHRACDDAEITAKILYRLTLKLREEGITDIHGMVRVMAEHADPKKIKNTYHVILFAKNSSGLKNLYKIVSKSYIDYFYYTARVPKTLLMGELREGIIVGSACEAGELFRAVVEDKPDDELKRIAEFYDYLEIQPLSNNAFMLDKGDAKTPDGQKNWEMLRGFNRKIVKLGEELGKPVCATCDAHFLNPEDEIYRQVLIHGKFADADRETKLYFRTTEEMLAEFAYLGEEKAYEVVVENTNKIADMIDGDIRPIPKGSYTPKMDGVDEELQEICWKRAHEWYGDQLPKVVEDRLNRELKPIIDNGFAVLYMIAQKLIANSERAGYLVGSRGSVGSSFVATMAGVSEVNPLPPHYRCAKCRHSEFFLNGEVGSGFDLPDKNCPNCGIPMICDGHEIPFETFLGFKGEKSPDIDLNFSGDVQGDAHKYCEELFGAENVFRAGTLGSLAEKTAFGFVRKYMDERGINLNRAEIQRLINGCVGVKRTTGQHPGGIVVIPHEYEIYDFTPVQHPADDPRSTVITTHFDFNHLHDTILKLDCLGHDVPTKYVYMERFSGVKIADIPMNDRKVYDLLLTPEPLGVRPEDIDCETGTFGLPELGTPFVRQMLKEAQPKTFSDLLQISGLSHGTGVWLDNARDLIADGTCTISECIGTRDSIMVYLMHAGLDPSDAFNIMETVRKKNKFLSEKQIEIMKSHNVDQWYIDSCNKIEYMFPKAHAVAYDITAIRLGWYKIYYPLAFYAGMLTVAPGGFDAETALKGKEYLRECIADINTRGKDATAAEKDMIPIWQLVVEFYARGFEFLPPRLYRSRAKVFLPEDGKLRIPFSALPGLGEKAAEAIESVSDSETLLSVEELQQKAGLSKTHVEILKRNGVLEGLDDTNQIRFF